MESSENSSPENGDYSAAIPLEISQEVASRADDLLREFAEDSGLETALIVDRSGSLVAGISAEAEVTIEVISALVAGASGAMRALVSQLGETGAMESLHLGGDRMIYLREIVNRFILVGVTDATRPAGLVRSKAHAIEGELTTLLRDIRPAEVPLPAPSGNSPRSLREVALRRAAERLAPVEAVEVEPEYSAPASFSDEEEEEFEIEPIFESDPIFEAEPLEEPEPELLEELEPEPESEPEVVVEAPPVEPREVLEPLDFGEPEIVIEPAIPMIPPFTKRPLPVDSPFEVEMDEADDDEDEEGIETEVGDDDEDDTAPLIPPAASVFELEAGDDEEDDEDDEVTAFFEEKLPQDDYELIEPVPPASFFELLEDDEDDDEEAEDDDEAEEKSAPPVFEFDDFDEDDDEDEEASDESGNSVILENDEDSDPFPVTARPGDSLFERPEEPVDEPAAEDESSADDEGIAEEIREMIDEEEEESEVRSSGPFYF